MPRFDIDGMMFQGETLSTDDATNELGAFDAQFNKMFLSEHNPLRNMYAANRENIHAAVMVAKAKLGSAMFGGGRAASTELTMGYIRPGHIMRLNSDATETAANTWNFTTTANEDNFLGYGAADNDTPAKVDQDALVVLFGWANETIDNEVDAVQLTVGNNDRPYNSFDMVNLNDSDKAYILPTPVEILLPKVSYQGSLWAANAGVIRLRPIGVTISTGEFARQASYGVVNK